MEQSPLLGIESRKLDTKKDKNDIENNEIEGSTKNEVKQETLKVIIHIMVQNNRFS